jgi:hypothetical protein
MTSTSQLPNNPVLLNNNQFNYFRQQEQLYLNSVQQQSQQRQHQNANFGSNVNRLRSVFFNNAKNDLDSNTNYVQVAAPPKHISRQPSNAYGSEQNLANNSGSRSRSLSTPRTTSSAENKGNDTLTSTDHLTRFQSAKALFARMEEESAKQRVSLLDSHQIARNKSNNPSASKNTTQQPNTRRSLSHTPKNYQIITSNDKSNMPRPPKISHKQSRDI